MRQIPRGIFVVEVRNHLNPHMTNFAERMIQKDEEPRGGTAMFRAMWQAASLM